MLGFCRKKKTQEQSSLLLNAELEYKKGTKVYLNVYHMTVFNYIIQLFGLGIYHSAIEINGLEYSFAYTKDDNSGIFYNKFGEGAENIWLKEKIFLGYTLYDDETIREIININTQYWFGSTYDPFKKNCNHFTKFFASLLLRLDNVPNFPDYVNKISVYGVIFSGFFSPIKALYDQSDKKNENNSSSNLKLENENDDSNNEELSKLSNSHNNCNNTNDKEIKHKIECGLSEEKSDEINNSKQEVNEKIDDIEISTKNNNDIKISTNDINLNEINIQIKNDSSSNTRISISNNKNISTKSNTNKEKSDRYE